MKYLNWLRDNLNFVSLIFGLGFVAAGKAEIGRVLIQQGGGL